MVSGSCKKGPAPKTLTLRVETTCKFNLTYYLYYGSKYDPFFASTSTTWERYMKVSEGNKILMKGEKDSGGTDANTVVFKILDGDKVLAEGSSAVDRSEIKIEYTYQ